MELGEPLKVHLATDHQKLSEKGPLITMIKNTTIGKVAFTGTLRPNALKKYANSESSRIRPKAPKASFSAMFSLLLIKLK